MIRRIGSLGYGRRVALIVDAADESAVRELLPHWWVDSEGEPDSEWHITSSDSARFVIRELELWVGEHAVDRVFVHAAFVAVDGHAILLPGRSFSGKTTLTAALLRAGASYGSDEYAVLRPDGLVEPYPRLLALRDEGDAGANDPFGAVSRVERSYLPVEALGAVTIADPMRIDSVLFTRFEAGAQTAFVPMLGSDGVLELLDNALASRRAPRFVLDTLVSATSATRWYRGVRGSSDDAAHLVADLVSKAREAALRDSED